jgi:hypothetical protein
VPHRRQGRGGPRISSLRSLRERPPCRRRGIARRRTGEGRRCIGRRETVAARVRKRRTLRTWGMSLRRGRATGRRRRETGPGMRPAGGPGVHRTMSTALSASMHESGKVSGRLRGRRPQRKGPAESPQEGGRPTPGRIHSLGYPRRRKNGGHNAFRDRARFARRWAALQRGVAETAYSRFPWSMTYPFHVPQEGHRAVHLMVEEPQEEHRKGMRYLRL